MSLESPFLNDPRFADIRSYIQPSIQVLNAEQYCFIDNNVLTDLALLAKGDVHIFKDFLTSVEQRVFIIPEMVLEESVNNLPTIQAVNHRYLDFYREIAGIGPVYVLTTEMSFKLYATGFDDKSIAFKTYVEIAKSSTHNIEVFKAVEGANTIEEVEAAYRRVLKDAGERFAFLFAHAFVADGIKQTVFLSNEIKGVYYRWGKFKTDELLRKLIYVSSAESYVKKFKVITFNKLLYDYLSANFSQDHVQRMDILSTARKGAPLNCDVSYADNEQEAVFKHEVNNDDFSKLVENLYISFYF